MNKSGSSSQRRIFFKNLLTGLAGGWMAGNILPNMLRKQVKENTQELIQVKLNPIAVPRTNKDAKADGS